LLGDEDESETNVEQVDSAGRNALMLASMAGSDDCIIGIVRHGGTNINAKDKMGLTAMHHAVCSVKTEDDTSVIKEVLEALVNHGSELTACDNDGRSIAHFAAIVGCDDILRGVADKFPVNQLDVYGHTPMHYACYHGRDNCVSVLVDDEVVMYNEFESPFGAFHCAAYRGNADCLETIFSEVDDELSLARVKSVDAQGMNPLHYAAARGHVECVKIMLSTDEAEDLDVKTADGQTPLNLAAKNGHHGACGDLVESGCELNLPESGDTFLHQLYNQAPIPQMDSNTGTVEEDTATAYTVLESVFYRLEDEPEERDVITSAEDTQGRTILHLAAKNHDQQSVELLLQDKGRVADQLDKKDSDGLTPLHHLIGTNNGRKCLDIILDVLDNKRAESAMSP